MQEKGLFEYWKECYTLKFKDFSGRARRREYWGGLVLFNAIFGFVVGFIFGTLAGLLGMPSLSYVGTVLVTVVTIVPSLAGAVRRLHDTGREWYFIFLAIVPIANLVLIYFLVQDSQPGENQFGPNPKGL